MKKHFEIVASVLLGWSLFFSHAGLSPPSAEAEPLVFSTWEGFEVDKCASIWLIKRFIDEEAVINLYAKGDPVDEGIPFDTPDAKFRRYHNRSTYESLLKHYKIKDPRVVYIGRIVHDIEVNIWEKKRLKETRMVQEAILQIIKGSRNHEEIIAASCEVFDLLYKGLED